MVVASDAPRSSPDVRIQLGPKAVVLEYEVKDAVTGKALKDCTLTVTRIDIDYTFGGSFDNRVLLPANIDMRLEFEVKGYQPWYYRGGADKGAAASLQAASGHKHLVIFLQPSSEHP
jgi:hypothetical protein